jgi:hypothetical protein
MRAKRSKRNDAMTTTALVPRHRGHLHATPLEARSATTGPIETHGQCAVIYLTQEGDFLRSEIIETADVTTLQTAC